jgi:hypothetical protein
MFFEKTRKVFICKRFVTLACALTENRNFQLFGKEVVGKKIKGIMSVKGYQATQSPSVNVPQN